MDFTILQDLELGNTQQTFDRMKHERPGLRKPTMGVSYFPSHIMEFLDSIPPLEGLSIPVSSPYRFESKNKRQFPLSEILSRHGATLRSLELHQAESNDFQLRRPIFSVDQIAKIHDSCPHLTHLGLDIDRHET